MIIRHTVEPGLAQHLPRYNTTINQMANYGVNPIAQCSVELAHMLHLLLLRPYPASGLSRSPRFSCVRDWPKFANFHFLFQMGVNMTPSTSFDGVLKMNQIVIEGVLFIL